MRKTNRGYDRQEKTPFQEWLEQHRARDPMLNRNIFYHGTPQKILQLMRALYLAGWGCDDAFDFVADLFQPAKTIGINFQHYLESEVIPLTPDIARRAEIEGDAAEKPIEQLSPDEPAEKEDWNVPIDE